MSKNIVIFAPHPDDETLACGGTIALNTRQGNTVYVVFMTDGRYSHRHTLGIETFPTPEDLKRIRREEAVNVMDVLGVKAENLTFLEYEDGCLKDQIEDAVSYVQLILRRMQPAAIYFPARADRHRDHKATSIIVRKSIQSIIPQPQLYQYVIWRGGLTAKSLGIPLSLDISTVLPTKMKALAEYKSQVTIISEKQRRPILIKRFLNRFLEAKEVFFKS